MKILIFCFAILFFLLIVSIPIVIQIMVFTNQFKACKTFSEKKALLKRYKNASKAMYWYETQGSQFPLDRGF